MLPANLNHLAEAYNHRHIERIGIVYCHLQTDATLSIKSPNADSIMH